MNEDNFNNSNHIVQDLDKNHQSCDSQLTRKEFLKRLMLPLAGVGAAMAAPRIIDKFLIPPAMAIPTSTHRVPGPAGHSGS